MALDGIGSGMGEDGAVRGTNGRPGEESLDPVDGRGRRDEARPESIRDNARERFTR